MKRSTVTLCVGVLLACLLTATSAYKTGSEPATATGTGTGTGSKDSLVFPSPSAEDRDAKPPATVTSQTLVVTRPSDAGGAFPRATTAVNGVAARLHALVDPSGRKNYIVSPVSVAVIVGQLLLAARGETQTRLRSLLSPSRSPRRPDDGGGDAELHRQLGALQQSLEASASASASSLQLHVGNGFFHQNDVRMSKTFMESLAGYYRSEIVPLDFKTSPRAAKNAINAWVSDKTNGIFDAILPAPLPPSTAAVLVNTLYFKAAWLTPFDTDLTITAPFTLNGTHLIDVTYMRGQFDILYADSDDLRCRMIVLPYKHKDVNMYVILPHRRLEMDIKDFADTLTPAAVASLVNSTEENSVTVVLPRMSLKTRFSLKDPIASYRPQDGVSSRLSDDDDAGDETAAWMTGRQNSTSRIKPSTTTSKTPTSKPRRPSTTPTTSQQPPRTTRGKEVTAAVDEGTTSKRPSQNRPQTQPPKYRPTPKSTTQKPKTTTTTRSPDNEFRFDLSGASMDPRFSVEDVIHQISMDVTELGTEAAAVSVVDVNYSGDIRVVKLDRPFVFFVRHEPSLSNLFWAVITDPTNGDYA